MHDPPARVAVVRMSAIGDTIHAVPVVASLREAWPETRITWVIQPVPLQLMRGRPDVDEFLVFHRKRGLRAYPEFRRRVRDRRFDLVINLHPVFKGGVVTRLLPARERLGYDRERARDLSWAATDRRIPARPTAHAQEEMFEFLEALDVPVRRRWDFHFTEAEREAAGAWRATLERPALAVVTKSSRPAKDWTLDRYARVLEVARHDLGLEPVLVGGASARELAAARRLRRLCGFAPRVELGDDLRRLAWLLDASDVVLSPDSGPLHLAVALGTPTVGLYGYTDPRYAGPYRRFGDLLVDRYTRPGETAPSRETRPGNMEKIGEDDVLEKLELALRRYVEPPV
ncbi:MAG: glycosyltransferase family 9 protein [Gemmatimonadota bacterium]|nr:glycosyltransferase family 9 protein [Gemmatimonadota bacterium]